MKLAVSSWLPDNHFWRKAQAGLASALEARGFYLGNPAAEPVERSVAVLARNRSEWRR